MARAFGSNNLRMLAPRFAGDKAKTCTAAPLREAVTAQSRDERAIKQQDRSLRLKTPAATRLIVRALTSLFLRKSLLPNSYG